MQHLLIIAGPTASGKTQLALALARRLDGELIGADSMQVYCGFDIGTAKPRLEDLQGVAHHLIDIVAPDTPIDAMLYARHADTAIAEVASRGRLPIVVGGTGLWLQALLRGLVGLPAVDAALRATLRQEAERRGMPAMHAELQRLDPLSAKRLHANDALRVLRALEVYRQTGEALGALQAAHAMGAPRYAARWIILEPPPTYHRERIEQRLHSMLEQGWRAEVEALLARYGPAIRPLQSVGYRQLVAHCRSGVAWQPTVAAMRKATLGYARHQRTWLRGQQAPRWQFSAPPDVDQLAAEVRLELARS